MNILPLFTRTTCSVILLLAVIVPAIASAQLGPVDTFFINIIAFFNAVLVPFVFALALFFFLWGLFLFFFLSAGDEAKRSQGKSLMMWGIIGLVVMALVTGIVNLLATGLSDAMGSPNTTNLDNVPETPTR